MICVCAKCHTALFGMDKAGQSMSMPVDGMSHRAAPGVCADGTVFADGTVPYAPDVDADACRQCAQVLAGMTEATGWCACALAGFCVGVLVAGAHLFWPYVP